MLIGTKVRLFPNDEQKSLFLKFTNIARFVYNECLAYKIRVYQESGYSCTVLDLMHHIQDMKYSDEFEWIKEAPEAVSKQAILDLDKAYKMFFKRGNTGFPRYKSKKRSKLSFYQRTDKIRMVDATHIKLTGIKEPVRVRKEVYTNGIKNPRVSFDGKFWYLSYSMEVADTPLKTDGDIIGIDLGVKNLAVTSDGVVYGNINKSRTVKKLERRKKRLQRKLSKKYLLNKVGGRYVKTNNIRKLENRIKLIDRRLKNIRDTYIHTITYQLVTRAKLLCIEDLNVSGMMKNKYLSKAIQEQNFYKFRKYLTYKCLGYGVQLVIADRFYPSTKIMSCCGHKLRYVSLSDRTLVCPSCGKVIDRDLNAAINLRNYAISHI